MFSTSCGLIPSFHVDSLTCFLWFQLLFIVFVCVCRVSCYYCEYSCSETEVVTCSKSQSEGGSSSTLTLADVIPSDRRRIPHISVFIWGQNPSSCQNVCRRIREATRLFGSFALDPNQCFRAFPLRGVPERGWRKEQILRGHNQP